ncbi:glycosyltransferase [Desulfuromonas thiophila]|uniref:Glycosyltransferase involved in cell wall bisynthesis n=1 Tax=Desulfuromonas thiophila TaxID=57664 RepID=A0A1G7EUF2_9BACT|nr:glycosyltransferase [Desulfuromonas thiophila]SDE67055.1 Glycosyltransferase involved in cell wall bisynthesis [Desulfuromonas thiophila]
MPRILVLSHTPTHPASSGNRARLSTLLCALQKQGHEVCLFLLDVGNGDNKSMEEKWDKFWSYTYSIPQIKYTKRIVDRVSKILKLNYFFPYGIDDWHDKKVDAVLIGLHEEFKFDIVLAEYVFFSRYLGLFSGVKKVLDTHDVFANRHKIFIENGDIPSWFYTTESEEKKGLSRADVVLAIQEHDRAYYASLVPDKQCLVVGHGCEIKNLFKKRSVAREVLFLGSGNNVNVHALTFFLNEVWPSVLCDFPGLTLGVAGSVCSKFSQFPTGCILYGVVDDLMAVYSSADVVINPVQFGTGLKIKNIEALGFGLPLLTTSEGAVGLESGRGSAFLVADTASEFKAELLYLLKNNQVRTHLSDCALEFASSYNKKIVAPLEEIFS